MLAERVGRSDTVQHVLALGPTRDGDRVGDEQGEGDGDGAVDGDVERVADVVVDSLG